VVKRTKASPVEAWQRLNKRQQMYLQAVFELDQAKEADKRYWAARGRWSSTPASQWRWMPYNAAGAALLRRIQQAGYQDQGAGSTWEALERRGLVLCRYEPGSLGSGPILFVQITKAGRKLVREALSLKAPKALPVGTLREWHWRALCYAYVRGDQGIASDKDVGDGFGYVSWNSILRLRDYKVRGEWKPLVAEKKIPGEHSSELIGGVTFKQTYFTRLCITEFGRQYYRENWQRYRELYPHVDAPEPHEPPS
jgi:hypothetical protein